MASTPAPKKATPKTKKPAAAGKGAGVVVPAREKAARKPVPVKRPIGAPSKYSLDLARAICAQIAECVPLRTIARMEGMPSVQTMMTWLADETKPEFLEHYARAREAQADKMAEDILSIADEECTMVRTDKHGSKDDDGAGNTEVVFDATAVARNRLRVEARKWLASKMAPKKYGDKIQAEHSGPNGGVIQVASTVTFVRATPWTEDEQ